ncbi:hypothetical protein WCP94_001836 [Bilophila wadsworthia]
MSLRFFELGVFTPAGTARAKRPAKLTANMCCKAPWAFPLLRRCCNVDPAGHPLALSGRRNRSFGIAIFT